MSGQAAPRQAAACSEEAQWDKWAILFQNPRPHRRPTLQTLSKAEGKRTTAPFGRQAQNQSLSTRSRDLNKSLLLAAAEALPLSQELLDGEVGPESLHMVL